MTKEDSNIYFFAFITKKSHCDPVQAGEAISQLNSQNYFEIASLPLTCHT